jgi:hypothetical protein
MRGLRNGIGNKRSKVFSSLVSISALKEDCIGGFCNRESPESLTLDSKHFAGGGFHDLEQTRAEIGQLVYETHIGSNPIALTLHNAIHSIEI